MSEIVKCKRCNRVLTSRESIERGYGPTCHRIVELSESNSVSNLDLQFLKCEINFLKRQLKELKTNGSISGPNIGPIERIKQEEERPEREPFKVEFNVVINELKMVFKGESFDYHDILMPIEARNQIEVPPLEKSIILN